MRDGSLAIVVATRNRADQLGGTLERLCALPERVPVVVVDNGSEDGTARLARRWHPRVEVVELGENLGAAARVVGVRRADRPYVAFSDDDSWWAPGSLRRAVELLERHPRLAVVAARVLVGPQQRLDPVCAEMACSRLPPADDLPGRPVLGFIACGAVVRSSAFLRAGGFHPRFGVGGEEQLLAVDLAAAGWGLAYADEVVAHHHPSPSREPLARRRVETRNELWSAWLRRPTTRAVRRSLRVLAGALADRGARAGVAEAVRGLPWVLRERRPLPPGVEAGLRRLERRPPSGQARSRITTGISRAVRSW